MRPTIAVPHWDRRVLAAAAAALLVLVLAGLWVSGRHPSNQPGPRPHLLPKARAAGSILLSLPAPDLVRPLTAQQAVAENAERETAVRADQPAAAFHPKFAAKDSRDRALECMTQTIYYEAGNEPLEGKQAVAQVVLNRVHHPAYPSTVCGVVYEGSERTTGCQFSFTCDGSLRRIPASFSWLQARKVATEALAGRVFGPVGHATYYHADYVVPYWADSLDKEIQIGRHIFYRLRGSMGAPQSFHQKYQGQEPSPLTPADLLVAANAIESAVAPAVDGTDPLQAATAEKHNPAPTVLADLSHGQLLIDEARTPSALADAKPPPLAKTDDDCPLGNGSLQIRKVSPTDTRLGSPKRTSC